MPKKPLLWQAFFAVALCYLGGCGQSVQLRWQNPPTADIDVVLPGQTVPAFRVLLPEDLRVNGKLHHVIHTTPGHWNTDANPAHGSFTVDQAEILLDIRRGSDEIAVTLQVKNKSQDNLNDIWVEICAAVNHLKGTQGWCNRRFIPPEVPQKRSMQGDYWYEQLTPKRLFALTDENWILLHPHPDNPDWRQVPKYSFVPGKEPNARACAVQSPDGNAWFFQTWRTRCYACTPCPGNACMHLRPFVIDTLPPGQTAQIEGLIGIHTGTRENLTKKINRFCTRN